MKCSILLFGIARDIVGERSVELAFDSEITVETLLKDLKSRFPKFNDLSSLLVAVNDEYAEPNKVLYGNEEIALIPPVSGG